MTISDPMMLTGYVIHTRKFRDSSLIVEFFSREQGRIGLLFRGARKASSKKKPTIGAAELTLFRELSVLQVSRGNLPLAKVVDSAPRPGRIQGQGAIIGMYVNELIYRLLGSFDSQPRLYDAYAALVRRLIEIPFDLVQLRRFELILLAELGFGIDFSYDASRGEQVLEEQDYEFKAGEGFSSMLTGATPCFAGRELKQLAQGEISLMGQHIIKGVVRQTLHQLLEGQKLNSRALLEGSG